MERRQFLATAGAALATGVLAGRVQGSGDPGSPDETPEGTPTDDTPTPTGETPTLTPTRTPAPTDTGPDPTPTDTPVNDDPGLGDEMNEPDPDLPVRIANRNEESYSVTVAIERADDGTVVHEETYEAPADTNRVVFNFQEIDPDGVQEFAVTATVGEQSDSRPVKTSECFDQVTVQIQSDGSPFVNFAIC